MSAPPTTGVLTYQAEVSAPSLDMVINENTDMSNLPKITVRLAQYRGGVFEKYIPFESALIQKGSSKYDTRMTVTSDSAIKSGSKLELSPIYIGAIGNNGGIFCTKAEKGISYQGQWRNEEKAATANIELTDTQAIPDYSIRSLTTSTSVQTAYQMALDCIQLAKDDQLMDCTVTGSNQPGSSVLVSSGEQIHINTITIRSVVTIKGQLKVNVDYMIPVGRTFTNR